MITAARYARKHELLGWCALIAELAFIITRHLS